MRIRRLLLPVAFVLVLASCGESPEGPGGNMTITVTQPPAGGVLADSSYTVVWETSDVVAGAKVTLAYDTDTNPIEGRVLIDNDLDPSTGTYVWNSMTVPEGTYYIYALIAGGTSSFSDYSEGTVTLEHPWASPKITIIDPPAGGAEADTVYTIKWLTEYFEKPEISLYYETDTLAVDTVLIVKSLDDIGSFDWDCKSIGAGQYYIFAKAVETGGHLNRVATAVYGPFDGSRDDSVAVDHSPGSILINHGGSLPQITILTPPVGGETADDSFLIRWTSLYLGEVVIDLYYDTDTMPGTGLVQIAVNLPDTLSYLWDCSEVPDGEYYIFGEIKDVAGRNLGSFRASGTDYSDGVLRIDHSSMYTFRITAPPAGGAVADSSYQIGWLTDVPGTEFVDLYYAADTTGSELFTIVDDTPNTGTYDWDCSSVTEGHWWIFGIIEMTTDTLYDWSAGELSIDHVAFSMEVTAPSDSGAFADSTFNIKWIAEGPADAVIDLFYDIDTNPAEMTEIITGLDNTGAYLWDCLAIPEGDYYIYANIHSAADGGSSRLTMLSRAGASDYSDSTLTINHEGIYDLEITHPPLAGAQADTLYMIEWITDAPDSLTLDLMYAADTVGAESFVLAMGVPNKDYYDWDCSAVPEGNWYVYGAISGMDSPNDWSPGQLEVTHVTYTMDVTAPPAGGASADSTYTIEWTATGAGDAEVDLYYDVDQDPTVMTEIISGLSNTGSYEWNTLSVAEGDWYVYAFIHPPGTDPLEENGWRSAGDYSDGTLTVTHTSFFILVNTPPGWGGAEADSSYLVEWSAFAPAGSTVDLYYDTDTNPGGGLVPIASDLAWDAYAHLWECLAVPEGEYYVYAELDDGSTTVSDYSDSTIVIDHEPLFLWITEPGPAGAHADKLFRIAWLSQGPETRVIDLYYDTDTEPSSGLVLITEDFPSPHPSDNFDWDCSAVPEGSYYIFGVLWDSVTGGDSTSHYSQGRLEIEH